MSKNEFPCPLSPCSTIRLQREKCDLEASSLKQRIQDGKRQIKEIQRMIDEWQIELIDRTRQSRELKSKEADRLLADIESKRLLLQGLSPQSRRQQKAFTFQNTEKERTFQNTEKERTFQNTEKERRDWKQVAMEAAVEDLTGCNPRVVIDECSPRNTRQLVSKMPIRSPKKGQPPTPTGSESNNLLDDMMSNSSCEDQRTKNVKESRDDNPTVEESETQNSLVRQAGDTDGNLVDDDGEKSVASFTIGEDFTNFFSSLVCAAPSSKNVSKD